ncbi:MAG TPA: hydrogenase expression/formation C-terminal domain-containing protein, partial [Steroidobacteraceae bacterium]|nr:hydrogenase expression/formation C-terminal domain-containing protein [Steroidobacteraceae bacterium]
MSGASASALAAIAVRIERSSGNLEPLLHQIRHALLRLLEEQVGSCIDLRSLPLAPGEQEQLLAALGTGEIRAELRASGSSDILETAFPGVWVVTHRDVHGEVQARFIEVTFSPEILCSPRQDVAAGLLRLTARLSERKELA